MDDRAEARDSERPVQEVCADPVHGRVDDLDRAAPVHRLVVDERAEVVVVLRGVSLEAVDERRDGARREPLQKGFLEGVRPGRRREVVEDAVLDVDVVRGNYLRGEDQCWKIANLFPTP